MPVCLIGHFVETVFQPRPFLRSCWGMAEWMNVMNFSTDDLDSWVGKADTWTKLSLCAFLDTICVYGCVPASLFVCLPVCLCVWAPACLSVCLHACLSVCMPVCLFVCVPVCLYVCDACMSARVCLACLSFSLYAYFRRCLLVYLPCACLSACTSVCLFDCLFICVPTCPKLCRFICLPAQLNITKD